MLREITLDYLDGLANAAGTDPAVRGLWSAFRQLAPPESRPDVSDGRVDAQELARTYAIRLKILRDSGREIGGFEQSIEMLKRETGRVAIGAVEAGRYHGLYFLDSALTHMVGFLYLEKVEGEDRSRDTAVLGGRDEMT